MAEITPQGMTPADVTTLITTALAAQPTSFVAGGNSMTISDLLANFPAGSLYNGKYARVSNLFNGTSTTASGGIDDVVRCRFDVANNVYRWVPQREAFNISMTPTGGTVNLLPLVAPPTVRLAGTLIGNLSVTPSATNAYIGQRFTIIQNSVLGLFVTSITGLLGSNLTLLGNAAQQLEYTINGWSKSTP